MDCKRLADHYCEYGFGVVRSFYIETELNQLESVLKKFHIAWIKNNLEFYQTRAVNSAYLTAPGYLTESERWVLFKLIASYKFSDLVNQLPFQNSAFMGTQLFFNPVNKNQKNYWHRDPQYHLSLKQLKQTLPGPEVIHFRIALSDEPGIELVPGSHKQWDTAEQLDVRLENNGKKRFHGIADGRKIPLKRGDLLIFSANMIHRGLYGLDRFALDILICEAEQALLSFVKSECLPKIDSLHKLENPAVFENTLKFLPSG